MGNRRRDDDDDDFDDRPRRKRRKSKKGGGGALWIVLIVVLLILGGGGLGLYFALRGGGSGGEALADASDRFLGAWQGTSSEHPSLRLSLEVFKGGKLRFGAVNVKVNQGETHTHVWKPLRASGDTLVIRQHLENSDKEYDWSITFRSDDQMSVMSLDTGRTLGDYARVGERPPMQVRGEALAKIRAKLLGKWRAPTLNSTVMHEAVFDFAEDDRAHFTITFNQSPKTLSGTWKVLEGRTGDRLSLQITGIEGFELLHVQILPENNMFFSMAGKGHTGVQNSATRIP